MNSAITTLEKELKILRDCWGFERSNSAYSKQLSEQIQEHKDAIKQLK